MIRPLIAASALTCGILACPYAALGQSLAPRAASLDSRYTVGSYSNEALADFGIEVLDLAAVPAEAITLDGGGGSLLRGIVLLVMTDFVGQAYKLSYHEFGHGTRAAATGFRPYFGFGAPTTAAELESAVASGDLHRSFFGYFLESFAFERAGFTLIRTDDVLFPPPGDSELDALGFDLLYPAGGLNNEMYFTEVLEDRIRRGGGHVGMASNWVRGKISAIRYAGGRREGDVGDVLDWYRDAGLEIERKHLFRASLLSLLLSGTSYELAYRTVRVFGGDPIRYEPWTLYGVELPSTAFYMNAEGLSYRVSTGYRRGRWRFPVAVEHVYNGLERTEVELGGEWAGSPFGLRGRVIIGEGLGVAVSADRRIRDRWLVSGGYALYDDANLFGQRMIPSLESGRRHHDFFVRLGVLY